MLQAGDLRDLAAAIAPRPLHIAAPVDHLNRVVDADAFRAEYTRAAATYRAAGVESALTLSSDSGTPASWFTKTIN